MSIIEISGKPLEKLIEVISSAIGVVYNPKRIRNEARAEADRNLILAKAKTEEMLLMDDTQQELSNRAARRLIHQEIQRQQNIETIADRVLEHIGETVSDTPPDQDWRTRFFSKAQDVSGEELQDIWARILAEELSSPGKTRLKTLDVLSNLSKQEATYFNTACSLALNEGALLQLGLDERGNRTYGMPYDQILILIEAGLIHQGNLIITFSKSSTLNAGLFVFGDSGILFKSDHSTMYQFDNLSFTKAGMELMNILKPEKNPDQIQALINVAHSKGLETRIVPSLNRIMPFY